MRETGGLFGVLFRVIATLNHIGGVALTCMMFLTVCDVLLRAFGHPIMGTYEIVSQSLAIVIGFGIPKVSADRGHVYMEFLMERLSKKNKAALYTFTRVICILLFIGAMSYVLFHRTNFGRQILAIGDNVRAAQLSGVRVRLVGVLTGDQARCGASA